MRQKRRITVRKTSSRGKVVKKAPLNASQLKLKERQKAPWMRVRELGMSRPTPYILDWEERSLASSYGMKSVAGVGYIRDGAAVELSDKLAAEYSWERFICDRVMRNNETAHYQGLKPSEYQLRDDQREDQDIILSAYNNGAPEFLIANKVGTGKTVTTWDTVKKIKPASALIICPSPVIPVWKQHIADMGDNGIKVVIINFESLKKLVSPPDSAVKSVKAVTQNKHIALDGIPYTAFDVVIIDEAHKTKNPTAQQSRISDKFSSLARFTLKLTATPGKDPAALYYLHRGLSWATGDDITPSDKDFSSYISWCRRHGIHGITGSSYGNGLAWKGAKKDLLNMSSILYDGDNPVGIKRSVSSWGKITRQPIVVPLNNRDRLAYSALVKDVKNAIINDKKTKTHDMSKGLAALVALRQKTGMFKAEYVAEYTKYCLEDMGEQVVISAIFKNTVDVVSKHLDDKKIPYLVITGDTPAQLKESNRRDFQQGKVKVLITSVTTGISLHAQEESTQATDNPRRMIIADAHWSPTEHQQLEGRINRNGQSGVITIPYLEDTLDEKVMRALLSGLRNQSVLQQSGEESDLQILARELGINI